MPKGFFSLDESPKGFVIRNRRKERVGFVNGKGKNKRVLANTIRDRLNRAMELERKR